jgi:hypothetical protein
MSYEELHFDPKQHRRERNEIRDATGARVQSQPGHDAADTIRKEVRNLAGIQMSSAMQNGRDTLDARL